MKSNYEILPTFPTLIYKTVLPSNLSSITSWFDLQPLSEPDQNDLNWGSISKDTYILDNNECSSLKSFILSHVKHYAINYLFYDKPEYKFTQSWISHKSPGEEHLKHNHSNSIISGVLYYGDILPNTPSIVFHSPLQNVGPIPNIMVFPTKDDKTLEFTPSPGTLILFPAFLWHSVPRNDTNKVRKSLAFNIVPKEGFGDSRYLNELKFN